MRSVIAIPMIPMILEAKLKECFDDISKRSGMIDLNAYKEVQAFDFTL